MFDAKETLIAVTSSQMEDVNTLEITEKKLSDAIKQQFGNNKDFSITDNGDGSFLVSMNDTQRMYYIDETGEVIDQSKMLKISTADELKSFRDDVNSGNTYEDWYVYLANDITLESDEEWKPIGLYLMENSSPDDETNKPFSGSFDGKNYEIKGLYINTTDKVQGLFGQVIKGSRIENCYNEGDVISNIGTSSIGGIVGNFNNSQISKCYNSGKIECEEASSMGGIVGQMDSSTIDNSFNLGNITGKQHVGGIAGQIYNNALLQNCYNTGNVSGSDLIGGILGMNSSEIYNCYNIGNITGTTIAKRWNSRYKCI